MAGKVVAIDIGSKNIHIAEGFQKGNTVEIERLAQLATPTNSYIEGRIEDRQVLKEVIRNGLAQNHIKSRNVALSMQGASVLTRELVLPEVKKELMHGMVRYEMEQYIPDAITGYIVEFRVLGTVIEAGNKKMRIRAAAMPRDLVQDYFTMLRELKLKPVALDIHLNAISKLFGSSAEINALDKYSPDRTVAVIDFGHRNTVINIISNGIIEFSRPVSYGSRDLDTAIAGFYDIPIEKAEQKKMEELMIEKPDSRTDAGNGIFESARSLLQQWMSELHKVFQYYLSRNQKNKLGALYLYGGGSRLKGLPEYMKQLLDVNTVIRVNSLDSVRFTNEAQEPDIGNYLNAIGALIRL